MLTNIPLVVERFCETQLSLSHLELTIGSSAVLTPVSMGQTSCVVGKLDACLGVKAVAAKVAFGKAFISGGAVRVGAAVLFDRQGSIKCSLQAGTSL